MNESALALAATDARNGALPPSSFIREFNRSTLYCKSSPSPTVAVDAHDLHELGRWIPAFSTLRRLGEFAGECDWVSMTGADLFDQIPDGLGVIVDPQDQHAMTLPPQDRNGG